MSNIIREYNKVWIWILHLVSLFFFFFFWKMIQLSIISHTVYFLGRSKNGAQCNKAKQPHSKWSTSMQVWFSWTNSDTSSLHSQSIICNVSPLRNGKWRLLAGLSFHPDIIRNWVLLFIIYLPPSLKTLCSSFFPCKIQ